MSYQYNRSLAEFSAKFLALPLIVADRISAQRDTMQVAKQVNSQQPDSYQHIEAAVLMM